MSFNTFKLAIDLDFDYLSGHPVSVDHQVSLNWTSFLEEGISGVHSK